jgi:hypothetical protein
MLDFKKRTEDIPAAKSKGIVGCVSPRLRPLGAGLPAGIDDGRRKTNRQEVTAIKHTLLPRESDEGDADSRSIHGGFGYDERIGYQTSGLEAVGRGEDWINGTTTKTMGLMDVRSKGGRRLGM